MAKKIDYTQFSDKAKPEDNPVIRKWWVLKGDELHEAIIAICQILKNNQSKLDMQRQVNIRLYGNHALTGIMGVNLIKFQSNTTIRDRISYNLVQSVVDTITSKIAKNKPKPLFLTNKGDFTLQRKAQKLNQFMDGIFFENDAYKLGTEIFRDACVIDTGVLHIYNSYGRIKFERCLSTEILVDEVEGFYGNPRQMHRVKVIDREMLIDMFPGKKSAIMNARLNLEQEGSPHPNIADQITCIESWHLPSGPESKDGMHTIVIPGANLLIEPWEHDFFPFAFLPWSKRLYGFWGQALAEQLQNIQLEINKLLWLIQRSMHLSGTFKIFLENGSKIVKEHLNNDIGSIITYTGAPPQYLTPPIVPPEMYQHLMTLKQAGYEQAGISMLSATSQKPAGLNSGKAMREYNDIETERFMTVGQAYERYFLDISKICLALGRDIYEQEGEYKVRVPGRKFIETIDWKKISMEEDQFVMQAFPVSSLPDEPAGRLQTVQEYIQAGFIAPTQGRKLLDLPDIDAAEQTANAPEERIDMILEKILDGEDFEPPDEFMNLALARQKALETYNLAATQNAPQEILDNLSQFMNQVDTLMTPPPPTPSPADALNGGAPQANPEAPPVSDLIPNVPNQPMQ